MKDSFSVGGPVPKPCVFVLCVQIGMGQRNYALRNDLSGTFLSINNYDVNTLMETHRLTWDPETTDEGSR